MATLKIKEIAESKNINISQLQKGTALDLGLVRRYWHNETSTVRLDALSAIARFLGVTVGQLFDETT